MNATSTLLILVGVFIVINTINGNLVGVVNKTKKLNIDLVAPTPAQTQAAFPLTSGKSTSSGG
jgi:hypothetical protein